MTDENEPRESVGLRDFLPVEVERELLEKQLSHPYPTNDEPTVKCAECGSEEYADTLTLGCCDTCASAIASMNAG